MSQPITIPTLEKGKYRHNKSGNLYEVFGVALETESDEAVVVYHPLYEHEYGYELFTRPYASFTAIVELDGVKKLRFEKVPD